MNNVDIFKDDIIPNTIKELSLINIKNKNLIIPSSVISLTIDFNFIKLNGGKIVIPSTVKYLTVLQAYQTTNDHKNCVFDNISFPNTITHLKLPPDLIREIKPGMIPYGITHLIFNETYLLNAEPTISPGAIPDSVIYLYLKQFNKPLTGILPRNLKYLKFNLLSKFNQKIRKGDIPYGTKRIDFGHYFNQSCKDLPNTIRHIFFGENFNKLKKGDIPEGVRIIEFGRFFDKIIEKGLLPDSLLYLEFFFTYRHPIDRNNLPKNLCELVVSHYDVTLDKINNNTFLIKNDNADTRYDRHLLTKDYYDYKNNHIFYYQLRDRYLFCKFIEDYEKESLKGNIIYKELIEKVFNPNRLMRICNEYNVEFNDVINNLLQ